MQKRNETFLTEQEEKQRRETPHKKLLSLSLQLHHLLKPEKREKRRCNLFRFLNFQCDLKKN
jgi:hypothetical protein